MILVKAYSPSLKTARPIRMMGSALISALFIMTLVAIAASAMSMRLQIDIYRTRLMLISDKLYLASEYGAWWAMHELTTKAYPHHSTHANILTLPAHLSALYPDVSLTVEVHDLQARFNLNNLSQHMYHPLLTRLLTNSPSPLTPLAAQAIVTATYQWIIPETKDGNNELAAYYAQKNYYPSHQLLQNISEFRLIHGVNAPLYQQITPYLIALPEVTAININTANKKLLQTLGPGLSTKQLATLLTARGKYGFQETTKLTPLLQKLAIPPAMITLESQYFMSITVVTAADLSLTNFTVFKCFKNEKAAFKCSIISQSLNGF